MSAVLDRLPLDQAEVIRNLFHDNTPAGFVSRLRHLEYDIDDAAANFGNHDSIMFAWRAMVAYIREAEAV